MDLKERFKMSRISAISVDTAENGPSNVRGGEQSYLPDLICAEVPEMIDEISQTLPEPKKIEAGTDMEGERPWQCDASTLGSHFKFHVSWTLLLQISKFPPNHLQT